MNQSITTQPQVLHNPIEKARQVFDMLDVNEVTRADYKYRIGLFLGFVKDRGFNRNSFLEFKGQLASRSKF